MQVAMAISLFIGLFFKVIYLLGYQERPHGTQKVRRSAPLIYQRTGEVVDPVFFIFRDRAGVKVPVGLATGGGDDLEKSLALERINRSLCSFTLGEPSDAPPAMTPHSSDADADDEELVQAGFRFALSLANDRHDAEDLVQQACLRVIAKKGKLASRGYLLAAIRNLFYDNVRRKKLIAFESLEMNKTPFPASSNIEFGTKLDLETSLSRLSVEEREVIYLNCVEGYSAAELASMLGKPRSTILNVISRAKARLIAGEKLERTSSILKGGHHG